MLALLIVGGAVFGVDATTYATFATLTLQATVAQRTNHGFYAAQAAKTVNFNTLFTAGDLGYNSYNTIDLYKTEVQSVGYYAFASTAKNVTVKFTVNPMVYKGTYVPYTFSFNKDTNSNVGETGSINFGNAVVGTDSISAVETTVITADTVGPKYVNYTLTVLFDGAANAAYGLPETAGEAYYSASIVAEVTAP